LSDFLDTFDIVISYIGVEIDIFLACGTQVKLEIKDIIVHPDWTRSIDIKEPLLVLPMPNPDYLLATAERIIKYSRELNLSYESQINYLKGIWEGFPEEERQKQVKNYCQTTKNMAARFYTCQRFGLATLRIQEWY